MNSSDSWENKLNGSVRIFRRVMPISENVPLLLAKFQVYLPDRPGSLAGFASTIAQAGGNISFFHYDRSVDSSRVAVEVQLDDERAVTGLLATLRTARIPH